jgi:polyisoprenoid-binding protein YceI
LKFFVALFVLVFILGLFAGYLPSEDHARNALRNAGYSQIELVASHRFFASVRGCSKDDQAQFVYHALNPKNERVTVKVCEGWPFKGATIRY